jgi:hypothetical protein
MALLVLLAAAPPWSTSLDALDPTFRAHVERVIAHLQAAGYDPRPSCTFRSPDVQDLLFAVGGSTRARGGQSCHNTLTGEAPAAQAVDLWNGGIDLGLFAGDRARMEAEVPYLRALGAAAKAEGLGWGGSWRKAGSAWDSWGLGWDPAHVQDPRCGH